mmetsp:Transcript_19731/g.23491  ORF Transcript_19731/g.23491 Transcript_19731/m.23491 type:complete len:127 (+) Transcript_19731:238-618(+)
MMHQEALSPRLSLLITPLASIPLILIILLALTVFSPTFSSFTVFVNHFAEEHTSSSSNLSTLLLMVVFIHFVEGVLATKFAYDLKLPFSMCLSWFILTLFGGNGTLSVIQAARMYQISVEQKLKIK